MLRELSVQNLAIIEDVRVELQPGFCAWTGETGAGKSLLLGALGLLLGERGSGDLLRSGADELRVSGLFDVDDGDTKQEIEKLLDTPLGNGEVLLARRLNRAGRSQAYVNDQPVAIGTLKQLGALLVDIHGQRESASLLQPAYQLLLLDEYGKLDKQRQAYLEAADRVRELRRQFAQLSAERQQRQRELSLLRYEKEELDRATLEPGEVGELTRERDRLANAQHLQEFAGEAYGVLYDEDGSVVERVGKLTRAASDWAKLDPALDSIVKRLETVTGEVQDLAATLRDLGQHWEADPERLTDIDTRLRMLKRLEGKYRKKIDDLILYRLSLDEQEAKLQQQEDDLDEIARRLAEAWRELRDRATDLSKLRHRVAKKLAEEAQQQLADLGMPEARLTAVLEPIPLGDNLTTGDVPAWGADQLELMLAANPGEAARPLRKVASGGELSRTMLALKSVLSGQDRLGTMIFDEIDANVGGRLGGVVGQKLAALGRAHQVICVTHLPQVASYARHHWTIRKTRKGKRTLMQIRLLADKERMEELASMLRGEARGDTTRKEVAAMLDAARRSW
jgi:DNA repair protein RecN (Recombination protein N)